MKRKYLLLAIVLALTLSYTVASASLVTFTNQTWISGEHLWGDLTMTFNDGANTTDGIVYLTLHYTAPAEFIGTAKVTEVLFNTLVNPITISEGNEAGTVVPVTNFSSSQSGDFSQHDGGNQYFNVEMTFPTSGNMFINGETYYFTIQGTNINAYTFVEPNPESWFTAAHIQGIPSGKSTWAGSDSVGAAVVPIPAAAWLLGSGLIGLVVIRRRMKK